MWKFWKRFGGKSSGASVSTSVQGSVADLRDKFYLEKHGTHGFPVGPSALAYDPYRHVMYIGTSNGELNMYGRPGVEVSVNHFDNYKVLQILPFQSEPSIITVCSNNILNKWRIEEEDGRTQLVLKRTYKFQGGLAKTITVCCLPPYGECLFVGTLGGITYPMDTEFDGMSPEVLSWSRARAFLKYKGKDIPGEVRALIINPAHPKQLLIGYEHGYLEIWNAMTWKPDSLYGPYKDSGDIRTACWHSNGVQFLTSHSNGSLCIWSSNSSHGPIAVKKFYESHKLQEISRVLWPEEEFIVFNGGAPHDLVDGDSVSIWDGKDVVTLQTTSPVKGIHIIEDSQSDMDSGIVGASSEMDTVSTVRKVLILMLEQEILFLELRLPELLLLQPPYLNSLHNSPLKEVSVHSDVDRELWSIIHRVGKVQQEDVYRAPCKVWPIDGGVIQVSSPDNRDLLLTGHEDGTVKFWDIKDLSMRLMYEVRCANFFSSPDSDFRTESPEPHLSSLRHIGFWDPRSDDDQLIVTCMKLCGEHLLVGFQGGHALLLNINNQTADCTIILLKVAIMRDDPRQRTRGWQAPLEIRSDAIECPPGFQPSHGIHFFPAVPVTSLAIAKQQGLLAIGCVYGFAVVDYFKNETVFVHSTFDLDLDDPTTMSRMQSIRRSFRHSLQRVNIRHSMRGTQSINRSVRPGSMKLGSSPLGRSGSARPATYNRISSVRRSGMGGASTLTMEIRGKGAQPIDVQAAVQAPRRDSIRTLQFTAPTHISGSSLLHGLLVGTNQGAILGFTIDMPQERQRHSRSPIIMPIEKEFNARTNHAVLFAGIIDGNNYLLDVNDHGNFKTKGTHYLIMCTEDMLRVINLPGQKKKFRVKFKQNEQDDFHIVSAHFIRIYGQSAILIMDSEGYISIYNLPELKLVYKENCVDASDAVGQRHFICSTLGLVLHQKSPSEFIRGSITDAARLDVQFTLPAKVSSPPQAPVRFSRPLSDGPHLVEMDGMYYGLEIEAEITDGVGPVDSKTSFESTKSVQSNKSVQPNKSALSVQSDKSAHSVQSDESIKSDESVHSVQSDKSKSVNSVQPNKSVQSENSIQSEKSVRTEKNVDRKSVELPDHYFTHHAPELKKGFKERAL